MFHPKHVEQLAGNKNTLQECHLVGTFLEVRIMFYATSICLECNRFVKRLNFIYCFACKWQSVALWLKQPATFPLDYLLYTEGEEVACHSRRSITVRAMTKADFCFRVYLIYRQIITHIHKSINAHPVLSTNLFFAISLGKAKKCVGFTNY
jgi:hypothetical protein